MELKDDPEEDEVLVQERENPQRKLSKREMMARQVEARKQLAAIKKMNSKELAEVVERNRLENLLIDQMGLKPQPKKKYFDGKQIGANIVSKTAENMGTQLTSAAVAKAINKLLGSEVLYANNKKNKSR